MEQWNYNKDFTRFEYENELITLCLLNWEDYLSYLPSLFVFDVYGEFLKKAENGYNENEDDDEDMDEAEDVNQDLEKAEDDEDDDDDDDDDDDKIRHNRWKMISKSIKRIEDEKFNQQYNEDSYFRDKELNKSQKNRLKELYAIREQKSIDDILSEMLSEWLRAAIDGFSLWSANNYSLDYFYKIRYIRKCDEKLLQKTIEKYSADYILGTLPKDMSRQATYASYLVDFLEKETFEELKNSQQNDRRDLYAAFDVLLGKDVFKEQVLKSIKFNILDTQFFSFLINTAKDNNGQYLRKGDFTKIDPCYWNCIKAGVINLIREHKEFQNIDISILFKKWDLMGAICRLNKNANDLMNNAKLRKQFSEDVQDMIDEIARVNAKMEKLEDTILRAKIENC